MGKQAAPRKVGEKEALAVGNTIRGSARKLNLVAQMIRGRKVEEALSILKFSPKAMADDVRKVLASAVANAENNHNLDVDALVVAEASVGKSISMKRFMTRARGRSSRIVSRSAKSESSFASRKKRKPWVRNLRRSGFACRSTGPGTAAGSRKARITVACCSRT